ncbi:trypsin-like peptidase domain-containing protein [bacterium]|nr:trypsin-like peptidase domain-containing protein [bacterium]
MHSTGSLVNRHSHITIILLSMIVGAVLTGLVLYYPRAHAPAEAQVTGAGVGLAKQLDSVFTGVAERTTPAVASIRVETVGTGAEADEEGNQMDVPVPPGFEEFFKQFRQRGDGGQPQAQPRGHSLGSGWIYRDDGYIVTNSHVVRGAEKITVKLNDRPNDETEYTAKLIGTDPKTELAVIKVDVNRKLPTLKLGNSQNTKVGQWVMAVGAPFSLEQTVTVGVVSAKGRFLPGQSRYIRIGDIIQTDASINPGNSGGPLVNLDGEVVGINVAIVSSGLTPGNVGIGFAVPADTARGVVEDLIQNKKVARGYLGIGIGDLDEHMKDFYGAPDGGALVESINKDGPAVNSDLKVDDVIVAVDGEKVADTWELQKAVGARKPGAEVSLNVLRDKKPLAVKTKLGEMPAKIAGFEEAANAPKAQEKSPLGVKIENLSAELAQRLGLDRNTGLVVTSVDPNGPSANKLDRGDVITQINRTKVNSIDDFSKALDEAKKANMKYVIVGYDRFAGDEWISGRESVLPKW